MTRIEAETIINYNMEEKFANVFTHDPAVIRRLEKLSAERPECTPGYNQSSRGKSFDVPKTWIKVSPPVKRQLTDEQRAELSERMKTLRSGQGK